MGSSPMNSELNAFHFSHPHTLESTTSTNNNVSCSACNLNIMSGRTYYRCKTCPFSLHYVCYKMPIITHHTAHSSHDLVLLVLHSLSAVVARDYAKCLACDQNIGAGFCYHCAECKIYYHTFCVALPLSLTISYHPHKMKLEFSPPYDFFCDLCKKPSYNGWLYRCNMCEFDTHVACAVENADRNPSFSQSSTLFRQIRNSAANVRFNENDIIIHSELMQLVVQQFGKGKLAQENPGRTVAGWDKRLFSPKRKKNALVELQQADSSPVASLEDPEERTPLREKYTPRSDGATPSYQHSELLFSIELTKPDGVNDQTNNGQTKKAFDVADLPSFNSQSRDKLAQAFLNGGPTSQKMYRKPNDNLVKGSGKDQKNTKSDSERYSHSGWRKLLSCCV